jgi:hypothetical protein
MVSPGNGDYGGNYSRFKLQWAMPGWRTSAFDSLFHSFDLGHFPLRSHAFSQHFLGIFSAFSQNFLRIFHPARYPASVS